MKNRKEKGKKKEFRGQTQIICKCPQNQKQEQTPCEKQGRCVLAPDWGTPILGPWDSALLTSLSYQHLFLYLHL